MGSERGPDRPEDDREPAEGGFDPHDRGPGNRHQPDAGDASGPAEGDDPFGDLTLDEAFIRSAPIKEPTAADRERAARQANLSRLLADEAAQRENRSHELRRFAPPDDGGFDDPSDDAATSGRRTGRNALRIVGLLVVVALVFVYVLADYIRSDGPPGTTRSERSGAGTASRPRTEAPGSTTTSSSSSSSTSSSTTTTLQSAMLVRPKGWPPAPTDVAAAPLGRPGTVPAGGGPHTFTVTQADGVTPVGYDPCRPIRFKVRAGGPEAGTQMIREAVGQVAAATGLRFVDEGLTDEAPSDDRAPYQPERYGDRWAPVLIAWSDPSESPKLGVPEEDAGVDVAGYAGSTSVGLTTSDPAGATTETGLVFVTGSVVLDGPDLSKMLEAPDGYARARAVVVHELAHLVGLGHVDDRSQLMYPRSDNAVTGFGAGDLQGLARLGSLACFPQV